MSIIGSSTLLLGWGVGILDAQSPAPTPPFGVGEELVYQVRSARFGKVGSATLRVEGPDSIRGVPAYLLTFDLRGRVGPFSIEDRTRSWIDPRGLVALRYEKKERHPLASRNDAVDLFPYERRWAAADGEGGPMLTDMPLDELSFIYLLRSLELESGAEISLDRHYQVERNPVLVRLISREEITLPIGIFPTLLVEMRVRDGRRFNGSGVIRLYLTDDAHRYPLRIETSLPVVGTMVLDLEGLTPAAGNRPAVADAASAAREST